MSWLRSLFQSKAPEASDIDEPERERDLDAENRQRQRESERKLRVVERSVQKMYLDEASLIQQIKLNASYKDEAMARLNARSLSVLRNNRHKMQAMLSHFRQMIGYQNLVCTQKSVQLGMKDVMQHTSQMQQTMSGDELASSLDQFNAEYREFEVQSQVMDQTVTETFGSNGAIEIENDPIDSIFEELNVQFDSHIVNNTAKPSLQPIDEN